VSEPPGAGQDPVADIGEYCRQIEAHLTRVNDGQIIRVVGPAFELVRAWAREGVPLSVVYHGIDRKAERHRAGRARRALRLEFCEADVAAVFEQWQRAVGVRRSTDPSDLSESNDLGAGQGPDRKPPAASRHLERAMERLARTTGRLDRSEVFREAVSRALDDLAALRTSVKGARGAARVAILERLTAIDDALLAAARAELDDETIIGLERQAAADLAAFRGRLTPPAWERSMALSVARLLRDHLGLPTLVDT